MASSLGRKPIKGGRPPIERSRRAVVVLKGAGEEVVSLLGGCICVAIRGHMIRAIVEE